MANFQFSVVAPDRTVVEETVQSVVAPGVQGYLGMLASHEPMIVGLKAGVAEYVDLSGNRHFVAIGGGFMEVGPSSVIILADNAFHSNEVDIAKEEALLEKARAALRGESSEMTTEEATKQIDLALNRIRAARMA